MPMLNAKEGRKGGREGGRKEGRKEGSETKLSPWQQRHLAVQHRNVNLAGQAWSAPVKLADVSCLRLEQAGTLGV
jgi:predicted transposase YdaD